LATIACYSPSKKTPCASLAFAIAPKRTGEILGSPLRRNRRGPGQAGAVHQASDRREALW
jgi:hypothetical protein